MRKESSKVRKERKHFYMPRGISLLKAKPSGQAWLSVLHLYPESQFQRCYLLKSAQFSTLSLEGAASIMHLV